MIRAGVLVISSKMVQGLQTDSGRQELEQLLHDHGIKVENYEIIPDERTVIQNHLREFSDTQNLEVVFTMGGTGVRPTDWAPEATRDVIDKEVPGIGEAMRFESLKKVRTAMLSRGTAGIRGTTLIINLPGSARGARENVSVILPLLDHTVGKISDGHSSSG